MIEFAGKDSGGFLFAVPVAVGWSCCPLILR